MKKKLKTSLLCSTFFYFISNNQLSANDLFSLDDFPYTTYTRHYNTLPSVEDTNEQLGFSSSKFNLFLHKAKEIAVRYDLDSYVGLRLTHSHFNLSENVIMSETYEKVKGIPSLVTYAHTPEEALERRAFPSSWILKTAHIKDAEVFEASSDPAVREGIKLMINEPEFMIEMADLLATNEFSSLLSLAILKRSALEPTHENQVFVEQNDDSTNKSIVQLWDSEKLPENTIRTSWSFKEPRQHACVSSTWCLPAMALPHYKQVLHKFTK